jgi:hypothetical protein
MDEEEIVDPTFVFEYGVALQAGGCINEATKEEAIAAGERGRMRLTHHATHHNWLPLQVNVRHSDLIYWDIFGNQIRSGDFVLYQPTRGYNMFELAVVTRVHLGRVSLYGFGSGSKIHRISEALVRVEDSAVDM